MSFILATGWKYLNMWTLTSFRFCSFLHSYPWCVKRKCPSFTMGGNHSKLIIYLVFRCQIYTGSMYKFVSHSSWMCPGYQIFDMGTVRLKYEYFPAQLIHSWAWLGTVLPLIDVADVGSLSWHSCLILTHFMSLNRVI